MLNNNVHEQFVLAQHRVFNVQEGLLTDRYDESFNVYMNKSETRLLLYLISKMNQVLSKEEILKSVWYERGYYVDPGNLTQAISVLRKKLKDSPSHPKYIMTIPKIGYKFICSVEKLDGQNVEVNDEMRCISERQEFPSVTTKASIFSRIYSYFLGLFI